MSFYGQKFDLFALSAKKRKNLASQHLLLGRRDSSIHNTLFEMILTLANTTIVLIAKTDHFELPKFRSNIVRTLTN